MRHMLLIPVSGEPRMVEADTNEDMRAQIGCDYVERVRVGPEWALAVDESGRLKGTLAVNETASRLYGTRIHGEPIVGNALLGKELLDPMEGVDWVDTDEEEVRAWLDQALSER